MKAKKWIWLPAVVLAMLLTGCALGNAWVQVDGVRYPRDAETLDLRGETITPEHYENLRREFPDSQILWDIPFQGEHYPMDTKELQVDVLTDEDVQNLLLFPELKILHAGACRDYTQLAALGQLRPDLEIFCQVEIDGRTYHQNARALRLTGLTAEELDALSCLRELEKVVVGVGGDTQYFGRLQEYCRNAGIAFYVDLGNGELDQSTGELTVANATDNQLALLGLLPQLETLHLPEPRGAAEALLQLRRDLPETAVTWEKTVLGLTFPWDAEEIDLSPVIAQGPDDEKRGGVTAWEYGTKWPVLGDKEEVASAIKTNKFHPLPDKVESTRDMLAEIEAAMPYFPEAKQLVLCGARLNNLAVSEFREEHREDFKLVWTVQCGGVATRTDATHFMPTKYQVYYFWDNDAYNLRYCEDMVAIDIGHMGVYDISFVRNMPNLKYLILTLSKVENLEPLSSCKNLVFLEMDWTKVKDYSPLLECTALEDLNIGETFGDMTPIYEMDWLKNLWLVGCGKDIYYKARQTLPDTVNIGYAYGNPDDGWRQLPNYFAMRDALLMFYML